MAFRCEYVKCGKANCRSCPHGPYWYEYWREGKAVKKRYHGKADPRAAPPEPDDDWGNLDRIFCRATASESLARTILGVNPYDTYQICFKAFKGLCLKHHPDRGGEVIWFQRVEAAWSFLKALKRW